MKNPFKEGDWVKILDNLYDAYEELWHEKGEILQIRAIAKDGEGLMFWSYLGIHCSRAEKVEPEWTI